MKVEELIKYRDKFNDILLSHQKKNKKWSIMSIIFILVGALLVIIPACIVGDNQGQSKPTWYNVCLIIGLIILVLGVLALGIFIYHQIVISKNKKYKETLSHELTLLVMKHKEETDKEFPFIK